MKILICGDSFAADYTVKYQGEGWPNKLAKIHKVKNVAQAGCSEYKILLQLQNENLSKFDVVIVSHTSPFRIYINEHPVHSMDKLHNNCDLIYSDVKEHSIKNSKLLALVDFFENYFDIGYAKFIHNLICKEIDNLLHNHHAIHVTNIDYSDLYQFEHMINFELLFKTNRGIMNHYDEQGNNIIYNQIVERL